MASKLASELSTLILLFLLIFGMSATVDSKNLRRQLHNKYAIIIGLGMQFIIMPLLGFLAVKFLTPHNLTMPMGISLLIVTSSPGGSYSNWWCSLFNADLALSVAMTALSTILSVALLPANLLFYAWLAYGRDQEQSIIQSINFGKLFISIGTVIGAILFGLYASYKTDSRTFRKWANRLGSLSGVLLILFSAFFGSTQGGEDDSNMRIWSQPAAFYIATISPCLFGLIIANIIARLFSRLKKPEVVTLSVECCYQNVGIATTAAVSLFDDPTDISQALAVPLAYGLVEAVILGIYCTIAWKLGWTKAPKDEAFCTTLCISYENEDDSVFDVNPESDGSVGSGEIPQAADVDNYHVEANSSQEEKMMNGDKPPVKVRANTDSTEVMSIISDTDSGNPSTSHFGSENTSNPSPISVNQLEQRNISSTPSLPTVLESPRIRNRFRLPNWLTGRDSGQNNPTIVEFLAQPAPLDTSDKPK